MKCPICGSENVERIEVDDDDGNDHASFDDDDLVSNVSLRMTPVGIFPAGDEVG